MILFAQLSINTMRLLLLLGLSSFAGGILLMIHHRRDWLEVLRTEKSPRNLLFETKKFKRRALVASLVSALGTVMVSTYWVVEPRTFAIMIALMFLILVSLLILASLDLVSVSLHQMSKRDDAARQAMIKKVLELREKKRREAAAESVSGTASQPHHGDESKDD